MRAGFLLGFVIILISFLTGAGPGIGCLASGTAVVLAGSCSFTFVMGKGTYTPPNVPMPAKGTPLVDPTFHTTIVRVSDKRIDGYRGPGIENEYAKVDPENSDGTLVILRGNDLPWYLYDVSSLQKLRSFSALFQDCGVETEPRWDATDPRRFYYLCNAQLKRYDLATKTSTTVHDFARDVRGAAFITTGSEGDASLDRRSWCLMVENASFDLLAVAVYDRQTDTVAGTRSAATFPDVINWVGMDMSGRHCVVGYESYARVHVFSRDFSTRISLPRGSNAHGDLALTAGGKDVFVYQNNATDYVAMADLDTGLETPLVEIPFSVNLDIGLHVSGNASQTPGWALVSTSGALNPPAGDTHSWMDEQLFMVELKARPRIWRIAYTRSYTEKDYTGEPNYFAEAFAAITTRGTRIYFGSNWGKFPPTVPRDYTEAYRVTLPDDWVKCMP